AYPHLWWQLATIISCGTLAAVLIPEFTKVFTSSHSKHVHEIVTASREGGSSLTILSGLVAGNFSAFWKGLLIASLMGLAFFVSTVKGGIDDIMKVQLVASKSNTAYALSAGKFDALDNLSEPARKEFKSLSNEEKANLTQKAKAIDNEVVAINTQSL